MACVSNEELCEEFSDLGVSLDNSDIIDKLKQLCHAYRLDACDIATQWVAFSHTNGQCQISFETIEVMERDRLNKSGSKAAKSRTPVVKKQATPMIYDMHTIDNVVDDETADAIFGAYSTPNGKTPRKRVLTPESGLNKRLTGLARDPVAPFSPASFSPATATPSKKFSSRSNSGEVACTWGAVSNTKWATTRDNPPSINQYDPSAAYTKKVKYMFNKLHDKAFVLNDKIEEMGEYLKKHCNIEEFSHIALPTQENVTVIGRVGCDSLGKMNNKSVVLEGSRETSAGKQIALTLTDVARYSLFPGQIITLDGLNSRGNQFVAKKLYESIPLPLPEKKPVLSEGQLSIVIATGPFTTTDSIMYEPLADLIKYLRKDPPDVCILLGPFLDAKSPETEKSITDVSFTEFFRSTMENISTAIKRETQLVIVPSQRDVHHEYVYPQPPFHLNRIDTKRVHFVSDPCTLNIDGVVIGMTSTDILFHLGAEEISSPPGSADRLGRLAQHIITQHSYYPLYPAAEDVCVDFDLLDAYGRLPVTPHILILPSELRYFIKDICGCCCVNPGRLTKGQVGGTFVRMVVKPPSDNNEEKSILQNIAAEVIRV